MSNDDHSMSRADIEREARRLRASPQWDPGRVHRERPQDALRRLDQELQGTQVYEKSQACQACEQARVQSQDHTSLCDAHLHAMLMGE